MNSWVSPSVCQSNSQPVTQSGWEAGKWHIVQVEYINTWYNYLTCKSKYVNNKQAISSSPPWRSLEICSAGFKLCGESIKWGIKLYILGKRSTLWWSKNNLEEFWKLLEIDLSLVLVFFAASTSVSCAFSEISSWDLAEFWNSASRNLSRKDCIFLITSTSTWLVSIDCCKPKMKDNNKHTLMIKQTNVYLKTLDCK